MNSKKEQPASAGRMPRLVVHLLKFGGCWIFALMAYSALFWIGPWVIAGTPLAVLGVHAAIGLVGWALYGMEHL